MVKNEEKSIEKRKNTITSFLNNKKIKTEIVNCDDDDDFEIENEWACSKCTFKNNIKYLFLYIIDI